MYDLADGYDEWLSTLDALQDEQPEPEPAFDPWTGERYDETEQEYFDRCPENDVAAAEWYLADAAEQPEPEPAPTQVADFFNALFEQDNIDALRGMATMIQRMADEDAERTGVPSTPTVTRGRPYVRPADDKARLATSIRDASRRYAHRSHRHQAGEES